MQHLPNLTEATIRQRAGAQSWARGLDYFESGRVENVVWRDGLLTADVEGSAYEPYLVQATFDGDEIRFADCTCPYDRGGDCKHIVATLLHLARNPEAIERRPSVVELIADLNRDELAALIVQIAETDPHFVSHLERLISQTRLVEKPAAAAPTLPKTDADLLRRQIKAELRSSLNIGYGYDWDDDSWYDSDLGAALAPALEQAQAYLEADDPHSALEVLQIATAAWQEGIDSLDEYVRDGFEDVAEEFTAELGASWAEAVLSAKLRPDERSRWRQALQELAATILGGGSLDIAIAAVEQDWDYPPLVAAMQGHITEKGAWEDEAPSFADELVQVRLRILDRRGQFQEYLNLAQAEGQFMLYLFMLVRLGQSEKAMAEAIEHLGEPAELHALSETLMATGETEKAFALARHGLGLEQENGKPPLAEWLRDQARAHNQPDLALWAAQQALNASGTLANYLALQQLAGDTWEELKPKALETIALSRSVRDRVDVYLHEKMYRQAIEAVDRAGWFYDIDPVIQAVKHEFPDWAFGQCRRRAESIMDAGRAKDYAVAVDWLRKGRDILLAANQHTAWDAFLTDLMDKHQRKYKLMPMLRGLEV